MSYPIDPRVDYVFKLLMNHEEILLNFLESVLESQKVVIGSIRLMNPFNDRDFADEKLTVVDVMVSDDLGHTFQVEIQLSVRKWMGSRMLYTWCAVYRKKIVKNQNYKALKPVFSIWILGENLFDDSEPHHHFELYDKISKVRLTDQLAIHTLELPKGPAERKIKTGLDMWMYFFEHGGECDPANPPDCFKSPVMREAFNVLQEISEEERAYHIYQCRLNAQIEQRTVRSHYAEVERRAIKAEQQLADARKREATTKEVLQKLMDNGLDSAEIKRLLEP